MDYKTKHEYKIKAKWFTRISLFSMLACMLLFFGIFVLALNEKINLPHWYYVLHACSMGFFLINGIVFHSLAMTPVNAREKYLKDLKYYRELKYFNIVLILLTEKKFDEARYYYNTFIKSNALKDMLFPYYVCALQHSSNEKDVAKGNDLVREIQKAYNPETVFNKPVCPMQEVVSTAVTYLNTFQQFSKQHAEHNDETGVDYE